MNVWKLQRLRKAQLSCFLHRSGWNKFHEEPIRRIKQKIATWRESLIVRDQIRYKIRSHRRGNSIDSIWKIAESIFRKSSVKIREAGSSLYKINYSALWSSSASIHGFLTFSFNDRESSALESSENLLVRFFTRVERSRIFSPRDEERMNEL